MTLPASPPITMAQVRAEFGGTAGTTKLSDYVRGGAYVPDTAANSGVPTSVPITLAQLCGASAASATLSTSSISAAGTPPGTVTTAAVYCTASGIGSPTYSWVRVSGSTSINATTAFSSSTTFNSTFGAGGGSRSAVFKCTVSGTGGPVDSNTATVNIDSNP